MWQRLPDTGGLKSMNKIEDAFKNKKAFIPFVTAGDPSLDVTRELILAMQEAGADLIEIGIPFSDPVAEGPVIQEADDRALSAGVTTDKIFDTVDDIADKIHVPIVFMTYINPIYVYGVEKFAKRAKACGAAGVIVPDVPFEEKEEIRGRRTGGYLNGGTDFSRSCADDCKRGKRLFILCFLTWCNRRPYGNRNSNWRFNSNSERRVFYSLCNWFWNFDTGTGRSNGKDIGWSNCRQCDCKNCSKIR